MKANEFRNMSEEEVSKYRGICLLKQNAGAIAEVDAYKKYLDKHVTVVKGRKVKRGTSGKVFWIGIRNYSNNPNNWWSWDTILGFKDENGNAYFTNENNVEIIAKNSKGE